MEADRRKGKERERGRRGGEKKRERETECDVEYAECAASTPRPWLDFQDPWPMIHTLLTQFVSGSSRLGIANKLSTNLDTRLLSPVHRHGRAS